MSNLLLQKIVLLRATEVGKIILKKKTAITFGEECTSEWSTI